MKSVMMFRKYVAFAALAIAGAMPMSAFAAEADKVAAKKEVPAAADAVDLFAAMEEGKIDVRFIPTDATKANVIFKNNTDEDVIVRLPETFGAVNVNAQMAGLGGGGMMGGGLGGMGGGGMGGMGGMGGGGMGGMGGQGMGGGFGGMGGGGMGGFGGGGMGGMGGGGMGGMGMGGMMRIAPDKTHKLRVTTLCLEHGKKDPNPRMAYKLVPLEVVNPDARVAEVVKMMVSGKVTQNTAQAAAWHFTDELDWQTLALKNRVESQYTGNIPFFSPIELRQAFVVAGEASRLVRENSTDSRYAESE